MYAFEGRATLERHEKDTPGVFVRPHRCAQGEVVRSDLEEVAPESAELAALEFGRIGIRAAAAEAAAAAADTSGEAGEGAGRVLCL